MRKNLKTFMTVATVVTCCAFTGCGSDEPDSGETIKNTTAVETASDNEKETEEITTEETTTEEPATEEATTEEPTTEEPTTKEPETEEPTTKKPVEVNSGIEASILGTHYAGDVLAAKDFDVKVVTKKGKVLKNPVGWGATPLKLVEGENKITVLYEDFSTIITVNVEKKPEGTDTPVVAPGSVDPGIFALTGPSVLKETPDMGQEYLDKIIFLGDSRTYSYKAYGVLSGGRDTTQVWTPRSGTMTLSSQSYTLIYYPETGADVSIRDAVAMKKPEYMVIGLGTNGLSYMNEETFKAEFRSLVTDIKSISPDTKVMLNSIFPVANYYDNLDLINNQKIADCNRWIMEIAEETGAKYLNTAEVLVDEQGWLNINYDNGGGATHLNKLGDEIVMNYIRTHGYK